MLILETTACDSLSVLGTILFIKKIIKILSIIVPVILILLISIDFTKAVMASNDDDMKRAQRLAIKRLIAGLIVFFVPIVVDASFKLIDNNGVLDLKCYTDATDAKVEDLAKQEEQRQLEKEEERQEKLDKTKKKAKKKQEKESKLRQKAIAKAGAAKNEQSTTSVCTNCSGSEKIALTAEKLAWPSGTKRSKYVANHRNTNITSWSQLGAAKPTKSFMDAMDKVFPDHFKWKTGYPAIRTGQSCDTFVGVVVKESGYDKIGKTYGQLQNAFRFHKNKWQRVSKAQRGDVCLDSGHVKIYLGHSKIAQASYGTHYGFVTSGGCKSSVSIWRAKK